MTESPPPAVRDGRGRFVPGSSGNPAGKKPGTRNHATVLKELLRDGEAEAAAASSSRGRSMAIRLPVASCSSGSIRSRGAGRSRCHAPPARWPSASPPCSRPSRPARSPPTRRWRSAGCSISSARRSARQLRCRRPRRRPS
ncbi:MAG: DUF5681 domain-containing protein [Pseudomonadota bacterium]